MSAIASIKYGLSGRFKLIRRDSDLNIVEETPVFSNLIVDGGLDWMGSSDVGVLLNGCHVGSGNTPPVPGDSGLDSFVAGSVTKINGVTTRSGTAPYATVSTITFRFNPGVATGNLSEVGVGLGIDSAVSDPSSAGNVLAPLFSRALITDGMGVPTTITVLASEYLDVIYELSVVPPPVDGSGNFDMTIDGVVTNFTYASRVAGITDSAFWMSLFGVSNALDIRIRGVVGIGNWANGDTAALTGTLGVATFYPSGTGQGPSTVTNATYTAGNYYRDISYSWGLSAANFAIQAFTLYFGPGVFQLQISPTVTKTPSKVFSITFRISWANA